MLQQNQLMKNTFFLTFLIVNVWSCSNQKNALADQEVKSKTSLINTDHLEHLYEEIEVDGKQLGTIWIYAEYPDYQVITDDDEGFTCVDDVARALVFYAKQQQIDPQERYLEKIKRLSEFILHLQNENGYFNNFIFPETYQINTTHQTSVAEANWWSWRALWALSEVNLLEENSLKNLQDRNLIAINRLLQNVENWCPNPTDTMMVDGITLPKCVERIGSDQPAVLLLGLTNLYQKNPSLAIKNLMLELGQQIMKFQKGSANNYPYNAFLSWQNYWHAWGNSQAYALLRAGQVIDNQIFTEAGLKEVRHFYLYVLKENFFAGFQLEQKENEFHNKDFSKYAQIAYGIRPMVYASLEAYKITKDEALLQTATELASWFFGNNPLGQQMYDPKTGRAFDGIISNEAYNKNSGAESTIEGLLTVQAMENLPEAKAALSERID